MKTVTHCIALVLVWGFFAGCTSFRFKKAWKEAESSQRWEGEWKSAKSSHGGRLRAVVETPPTQSETDAFFEAHWHGFVTAYKVSLHRQARRKMDSADRLNGQHNLRSCVGGGTYRYDGTLTEKEFKVHYESSYDTGDFVLKPAK